MTVINSSYGLLEEVWADPVQINPKKSKKHKKTSSGSKSSKHANSVRPAEDKFSLHKAPLCELYEKKEDPVSRPFTKEGIKRDNFFGWTNQIQKDMTLISGAEYNGTRGIDYSMNEPRTTYNPVNIDEDTDIITASETRTNFDDRMANAAKGNCYPDRKSVVKGTWGNDDDIFFSKAIRDVYGTEYDNRGFPRTDTRCRTGTPSGEEVEGEGGVESEFGGVQVEDEDYSRMSNSSLRSELVATRRLIEGLKADINRLAEGGGSSHTNGPPPTLIDYGVFVVCGIFLIFIMDQFVNLGKMMMQKKLQMYYPSLTAPLPGNR